MLRRSFFAALAAGIAGLFVGKAVKPSQAKTHLIWDGNLKHPAGQPINFGHVQTTGLVRVVGNHGPLNNATWEHCDAKHLELIITEDNGNREKFTFERGICNKWEPLGKP